MTRDTENSALLPMRRRRENSKARLLLTTNAAELKATCTKRGRLAVAHKDCTMAEVKLITTTWGNSQTVMPNRRNKKLGETVLSSPGTGTLRVEARAAKPR